jgi:TolB-like protein
VCGGFIKQEKDMKNYGKCRLLLAALLFALPLLAGLCACTTRPAKDMPDATAQKDAPPSAAPVQKAVEPPLPPPPGIAVLVPESRGLNDAEAYLPTLVQGVLVGDFTAFSTMRVIDRQSLDKVIAEGESGVYTDESGFAQLGSVANVQYVMSGALQKTGSGFSLQIKVTEAASGESKAAYIGACTAAELENLTGVKKASADLLTLMGVNLTDAQKTSLLGTTASIVQAETALSRGIVAQKGGSIIASLAQYYEAMEYNPSLAEAASRLNALSASVRSGSMGTNIRNDIAWRKEWIKLIDDAKAYVWKQQFPLMELVYHTELSQDSVDYQKETVSMSFLVEGFPIKTPLLKMMADVRAGLVATGRNEDWDIYCPVDDLGTPDGAYFKDFDMDYARPYHYFDRAYEVSFNLLNDRGKIVSRANITPLKPLDFASAGEYFRFLAGPADDVTTIRAYTWAKSDGSRVYADVRFTVKADDITDSMTIEVQNIKEYFLGNVEYFRAREAKLYRQGKDIIPIRAAP